MIWIQAAVLALAAAGQGEPVLMDFTAVWCGPCRQMSPTIDRLAASGCRVKRIDFDQNRDLAEKYGVSRLPCFVVVANGQVIGRVEGITSYDRLMGLYRQAETAYQKAVDATRFAAADPPPAMPIRPASARTVSADRDGLAANSWAPRPQRLPPMMINDSHSSDAIAAVFDDRAGSSHGTGISDDDLIAASVRIRVQDTTGQSCGTGTIIDSRQGWALILTCGHIFRDFDGTGGIEVDLFSPGGPQKVEGTLVSRDLENDIGLLRIPTLQPVRVARVAPPTRRIAVGEAVINVGCNNGEPPTARHTRISSINKYLGPANIQAGGLPVEGRSGGGLFSNDGMVIGVCNCADPKDNEGLYAAAELIRAELDRAKLSFVYHDPQGVLGSPSSDVMLASATQSAADNTAAVVPAVVQSESLAAAANAAFATGATPQQTMPPQQMPSAADLAGAPSRWLQPTTIHEPSTRPVQSPLSRAEAATLEEIARKHSTGANVMCVISPRNAPQARSESITLDNSATATLLAMASRLESGRQQLGAEVVCVIRPRANAGAKSEIIVLDQGSTEFLRALSHICSRNAVQFQ